MKNDFKRIYSFAIMIRMPVYVSIAFQINGILNILAY